jgi:RNA polymerase sigma factor (sigma-70 family)
VNSGTAVESFEDFVRDNEPRLRAALSAMLGTEAGREATAEALAYGWEHWRRVAAMDNPAGYLYTVGRDRGLRSIRRSKTVALMPVDQARSPWVEPQLPDALAALPERQRVVLMLHHCFQWTLSEVADFLELSKSSVQSHAERGLASLRKQMGVTS